MREDFFFVFFNKNFMRKSTNLFFKMFIEGNKMISFVLSKQNTECHKQQTILKMIECVQLICQWTILHEYADDPTNRTFINCEWRCRVSSTVRISDVKNTENKQRLWLTDEMCAVDKVPFSYETCFEVVSSRNGPSLSPIRTVTEIFTCRQFDEIRVLIDDYCDIIEYRR